MEWLIFAIITALLYGFFDFFIKKASGNIDDGLSGMIINLLAFLVMLIYVLVDRVARNATQTANREGIVFSVLAGITVGLLTITFIKMFSTGANLSLGVLVVRVGAVLVAVALSILLLQEKLSLQQIIGFILALGGLGLVLFK